MGCQNAPLKTGIKVWMIDSESLVLYRRKDANTEVFIPIKDAKKYMCISGEDFEKIIRDRK